MTTGRTVRSGRSCTIKVSCRNHSTTIALSLRPETAIELVVGFNRIKGTLPVDLKREGWTLSAAETGMDSTPWLDESESSQ